MLGHCDTLIAIKPPSSRYLSLNGQRLRSILFPLFYPTFFGCAFFPLSCCSCLLQFNKAAAIAKLTTFSPPKLRTPRMTPARRLEKDRRLREDGCLCALRIDMLPAHAGDLRQAFISSGATEDHVVLYCKYIRVIRV